MLYILIYFFNWSSAAHPSQTENFHVSDKARNSSVSVTLMSQNEVLLIAGFIQKFCNLNIPVVFGKLIRAFYEERFYWNIDKNEMSIMPQRKCALSKEVKVDNISFALIVDQPFMDGYIYYGLGIQSFPPDCRYISLYAKMECKTTTSAFHKMIKITKSSEYYRKRLLRVSEL